MPTETPVATYVGGHLFRCPWCQTANIHSPSEPGKPIREEFGTTRRCERCPCDYYLVYDPRVNREEKGKN